MKTGCRDLAPNTMGYLVTERDKFKVRTKLPAVALTTTVAEPSVAVEAADNFKAVLPLPGEGNETGAKPAVTPAGSPCTEKLTAALNPPSTAAVSCAVVVPPRLSISAELLAMSVVPGMAKVNIAVLVTPPPVAVTVSA